MFDKWIALRAWVFAKPARKAVAGLVLFVPIFCLLRLITHPNVFLADLGSEILFAIVFAALLATLVYGVAVQQMKK
jgi:hypothetical protein